MTTFLETDQTALSRAPVCTARRLWAGVRIVFTVVYVSPKHLYLKVELDSHKFYLDPGLELGCQR